MFYWQWQSLGNHCISRAGARKQFLIANDKTIYAFVTKGKKFPTCSAFEDKTCDISCKVMLPSVWQIFLRKNLQAVDGLTSISLSGSKKKRATGRVYTGNSCEWININEVVFNIFKNVSLIFQIITRWAATQIATMATSLSSRTLQESTEDSFCLLKERQSWPLYPMGKSLLNVRLTQKLQLRLTARWKIDAFFHFQKLLKPNLGCNWSRQYHVTNL